MKLFLSDDNVQVSLVENQYTISSVDDAVKVYYSNGTAEGGAAVVEQMLDTEIDESNAGVVYVGQAPPGSSGAAPVWRIKKIADVAGGTSVNWAGGNAEFVHVWNNRASLVYGP